MQPTAAQISHPTSAKITTPLKDIQKTLPLRVLSQDDWRHWITKGFVIVRNAVPVEKAERLASLLWEFDEKDPDDDATWYAPQRRPHARAELNNAGMVEIYNHQYLWDNRMEPRVYNAFVDIWDREDLWTTIDRANLNPPKLDKSGPSDGFIHWDVDTKQRPLPIGVQGVLSLKTQTAETGGFQCVPYLFEHLDEWAKTQPEDRNPLLPDMTGLGRENIDLNPGDLMIFNSLLAHGVRPNLSADKVRMAQYISMQPAEYDDEAQRLDRIRMWRDMDHPDRPDFPGDPRDWEKHNAKTATLTVLGEKLLGSKPW
jgi:ectoine hydroxylase-related dioxygenase (phytanoyl-CoA dioxygenase family)